MKKTGKIRHDCSIEKAVCELISPKSSSIIMDVADVEQQKGGNDCGLFAITYAALLSKRKDPTMFDFQQCKMRSSLLQSFAGKDISIFMEQPIKLTHITAPSEVQTWNCRIYCHCKMPHDGKLMVKCTACDAWLHGICESQIGNNNFSDSQWTCSSCQFKKKQSEESRTFLRKKVEFVENLAHIAATNKETDLVISLYDDLSCSWVSFSEGSWAHWMFHRKSTEKLLPRCEEKNSRAKLSWNDTGWVSLFYCNYQKVHRSGTIAKIQYNRTWNYSCTTSVLRNWWSGPRTTVQTRRKVRHRKNTKMQGKLSNEYQRLDIDSNTILKAKF